MYVLLQIIAVTVLLLLAQEALRRAARWAVWGVFLLMPLILTPYWLRVNELGLFPWFKFYTIFFCVCWGTALRFTSLGNRAWARSTIPQLLAVNIFEAVVLDLFGHGSAHALNAAAGLLLIATLPYCPDSTLIASVNRCRDLLYRTSKRWVIGYTLWNWTFVYLNYPSLTGHHTAVLAAGLIVAMNDPGRWSQTRASTLGVNLLFSATFFNGMIAWMDTSTWFDEQVGIVAAGFALVFMAGCTLVGYRADPPHPEAGEARWQFLDPPESGRPFFSAHWRRPRETELFRHKSFPMQNGSRGSSSPSPAGSGRQCVQVCARRPGTRSADRC